MIRFFIIGALGVIAAFGLWFYGFTRFIEAVPRTAEDTTAQTEAIVVLTGGNGRLREGFDLLAHDMAAAMFISGVTPGVNLDSLLAASGVNATEWKNRVSIGYQARNTSGNAEETARWIDLQGIRSLRLVTENYHLPRSLIEFRRIMPDIKIIPHAVVSADVHLDSWWRWPGTAQLLIGEYNKYLIVRLSELWGI